MVLRWEVLSPFIESMNPEKNAEIRMISLMSEKWMVGRMFATQLEECVVYRIWRCWSMIIGMTGDILGCSF